MRCQRSGSNLNWFKFSSGGMPWHDNDSEWGHSFQREHAADRGEMLRPQACTITMPNVPGPQWLDITFPVLIHSPGW